MPETPAERAARMAERKRVDDFISKGKASIKSQGRGRGPATASQLAERKKIVAADNRKTARLNAAGRNAATRKSITPSGALASGLQGLVDTMGKKKEKERK
jgi:hypothetical protein